MEEALARLRRNLRGLRKERGYTLEQAAARTGVHDKTLQQYEASADNPTVATLAAIALGYDVPLPTLFEEVPFYRLPEAKARPYRNCVPLYSLKAAAGRFSEPQEVEEDEPEAWVVPAGDTPIAKGLFVARVEGESMNRHIRNGGYGLFRTPVPIPVSGQIVLVQHRDVRDPDHGGRYTLKMYKRAEVRSGKGIRINVTLEPQSTLQGYRSIDLPESEQVSPIAELVEVLPGAKPGTESH